MNSSGNTVLVCDAEPASIMYRIARAGTGYESQYLNYKNVRDRSLPRSKDS